VIYLYDPIFAVLRWLIGVEANRITATRIRATYLNIPRWKEHLRETAFRRRRFLGHFISYA